MKKLLLVLFIINLFSISDAEKKTVGLEFNAGYLLQKYYIVNNNHFFLGGNILFHIRDNFYARIRIGDLSFYSSGIGIDLATGLFSLNRGTGFDLMLFGHSKKIIPYGIGGLQVSAGGWGTYLSGMIGSGVEYNAKTVFPFVEVNFDINELSIRSLGKRNAVTLLSGVRIK